MRTQEEYQAIRKEASDLGVMARGDTVEDLERKIEEAKATRTDPRTEELKAREGDRVPLGGYRLNLKVPAIVKRQLADQGYHLRFFTRDNLQRARDAGFTQVNVDKEGNLNENGEWFRVVKGRTEDGSSSVNYLMKQLIEHRQEDQAAKRQALDEVDQALQRGNAPDSEQMGNAVYNPTTRPREINEREFRR